MSKHEITQEQLEQLDNIADYMDCWLDDVKELMLEEEEVWGVYDNDTGRAAEYLIQQQYAKLNAVLSDIKANMQQNLSLDVKVARLEEYCGAHECSNCALRSPCSQRTTVLAFAPYKLINRINILYEKYVSIYGKDRIDIQSEVLEHDTD